jgi:putative ABC transport system permease protein
MLSQDLRYAVRTLVQNPGFAALAVLCLALGIGVNATIFSVLDGVLLQPYPYADADRIVVLNSTNPRRGINRSGVSWLDFRDWRDQNTTIAAMVAFSGRSLTISDGTADPERFLGSAVTWTLFGFLGTPPALGRDFGPDDDRPGAEPVVMLSDDVWRRRYNSDPGIIGRSVSVNGRPHTVIGVMPPRFMFPETQRLWVPLASFVEKSPRTARNMQVFAKLKPGVTIDQATTDLKGVATRLESMYPEQNSEWSAYARALKSWMIPADVNLIILSMMSAATLVLLVACANVANLLLARASVRHREISIRSALGAGRWRIVRQLLTEAIVIGAVSAPLGMLFARLGVYLLDQGIPPDSIPYFIHWALDARSLSYTIAISVLTGLVFGLAPALTATRSNLQESLKEGGRGSTGGRRARLRNGLVIAEVSMSLVLLIGASLFVRSFLNLQNANVGFDTSPLMTMRFFMSGAAYESADAKARRVLDIVRRVETIPGVQSVFASNFVPLWGGGDGGRVLVDGKSYERGKEPEIAFIAASPQFRKTMGVALVRGRDITESEETTRTTVALIN